MMSYSSIHPSIPSASFPPPKKEKEEEEKKGKGKKRTNLHPPSPPTPDLPLPPPHLPRLVPPNAPLCQTHHHPRLRLPHPRQRPGLGSSARCRQNALDRSFPKRVYPRPSLGLRQADDFRHHRSELLVNGGDNTLHAPVFATV